MYQQVTKKQEKHFIPHGTSDSHPVLQQDSQDAIHEQQSSYTSCTYTSWRALTMAPR